MLKEYLKKIAATTARGDAREESYYPDLKTFLLAFADNLGKKGIDVTVLPKKTEAGNPDFRIWDGEHHIVGYIEAKPPGTILDQIEFSDQLKRYRSTFPNLILTDFYEFRLYRDGDLLDSVSIGRPFIAQKLKTVPPTENEEDFIRLLDKFFSFVLPKVFSAQDLALELAKRTRFLKEEVVDEELKEEEEGKGTIMGFYKAFKDYLIAGITPDEFADLFSQTLTYGLFAARTRATNGFNRKLAYEYIPPTIGILRDVFRFVSSTDLPKQMEVIVDDIAEVLHVADVNQILDDYYHKGKGQDPIVHFYETFLAKYDPAVRERRGVYYTPEPVVRYIVRSLHHLLKTKFELNDGLASKEVTLLDPAGGTLTFPVEAIKLAVEEYTSKYGEGGKHNLIKNQILKNYTAFELMMAPYAIGHLKATLMLEELGYRMEPDDRFRLYLTNTLDMEELDQTHIPGLDSLSEESKEAGKVKKKEPILVILGNPPYSGHSANISNELRHFKKGQRYIKGYQWDQTNQQVVAIEGTATKDIQKKQKTFAGEILMDYYFIDGKPLDEKNPKWLQDDYVKFLRFAQWKIQKAGQGMVGMITNHSYLDNPTFRGMRQSLMLTFNEIYILNLHGNSLKKETCPDGSKDENVFDIRQGVAIALFVKQKDRQGYKVFHADRWGLRKEKYAWMEANTINTCGYEKIKPQAPYYFFIKRYTVQIQQYLEWRKISEIFPVNSVGIVTARDKLTIHWTENQVWNTVLNFSNLDPEIAREAYQLGKDVRDWKVSLAQKDLKKTGPDRKNIHPILYRPFDMRYTYYTGTSRGFQCMPRPEVMRHILQGENVGLIVPRQFKERSGAFITKSIIGHKTVSAYDINSLFPLYLYPDHEKMNLFKSEQTERKPNILANILKILGNTYGEQPKAESIMHYIYAVLYSNTFRERYAEFLKIDFPRIPFTSNYAVFKQVAEMGEQLTALHLLKSPVLEKPLAKYEGGGTNDTIEKPVYKEDVARVYINTDKYITGVKPEVWKYNIGGYQVLNKYLKDRKGRQMDDPRHYCRVVTALDKTIDIQKEIDNLYESIEKNTINFQDQD